MSDRMTSIAPATGEASDAAAARTPSGVPPLRGGGWFWRLWTGATRAHLRCEDCGVPLVLAGLRPGSRARCGGCGSVFRVPGSATADRVPTLTPPVPSESAMPTCNLAKRSTNGAATVSGARRVEAPPRIGPYELQGEIARGGTAIVYRGRHEKLGKSVAIKLLLPHLESGHEMERRLFREALALARFRHPHIVPVLDAGTTENGLPYLVMELVEGEDLGRRLQRDGPLEWRAALEILVQVAEAVDFAHAHGVIHRDLKPANILLDRQDRAQLVDFGLARDEGAGSRLTATGIALGTPAYMPPEQARGNREDVGRRADLYSLGAILYEMVTGRAPFGGDTVMEVLYRVVHEQPVSPRKLQPRLPGDVEAICLKLLEKDPRNRYASAYQLLQDLQACLAGKVPSTARPGRTPTVLRFLRRSGWRAGLLAIALLGGLAYWAAQQSASQRAEELIATGRQLLAEGRFAEAEAQFSEAQNLRPQSAAAFVGRQEARQRLRDAEESRQAQTQQRQQELLREFRQVLDALSTERLQASVREGTEKLTELVARILQPGVQTPEGEAACEFETRTPGTTLRILPLLGEEPLFEGLAPARVPLGHGAYRLLFRLGAAPEREALLQVAPNQPQRLVLDEIAP